MSSNEKNSLLEEAHHGDVLERQRAVGDRRAERLADRQPRHVDAGADGERHRAGEAGVDLEQRRLAGRVALDLHVGDRGQADQRRDLARERLQRLVVQRAAGDGDPRVDLQALARHDRGDVPVGAREHVERVLRARQVLLHEQRAVALERLQLGAPLDQPDAARAAARARLDDHRQLDRGGVEGGVDDDGRRARARDRGSARPAPTCRGRSRASPRCASTSVVPAAANSSRRRASGSSSVSTVGITTSIASRRQRSSSCVGEARVVAARQDRAPRRIDEVEARAERVDVARQHRHGLVRPSRAGSRCPTGRRRRSRARAGSQPASRTSEPVALGSDGERRRVAVAHDLERLHVARLAEARPVAGGGAQQLLVEVVADLDLRREGLDDLDLALEELVDRDEARRLELDAWWTAPGSRTRARCRGRRPAWRCARCGGPGGRRGSCACRPSSAGSPRSPRGSCRSSSRPR